MYNYSTCYTTAYLCSQYTNRAFTRSVHQLPTYASSALIKHRLIKGEAHQYIDYIVCLNRIDSYHHLNKHTILYIFYAPGYNSLVLLNWYKH